MVRIILSEMKKLRSRLLVFSRGLSSWVCAHPESVIFYVLLFISLVVMILTPFVMNGQPAWIDTAERYVGIRERTGRNDGVEVERFLGHVGLPAGYPWCAAFACYCLHQGGAVDAPRSGWSPDLMGSGSAVKDITQARRGDLFGVLHRAQGRVAHVGFIAEVKGSWAITVEGNTNTGGGREGDGVYRRRRSLRTLHRVRRF